MFRFVTGVVQSNTRQDIDKDDTIEINIITVIVKYYWSATLSLTQTKIYLFTFQFSVWVLLSFFLLLLIMLNFLVFLIGPRPKGSLSTC